MQAIKDNLVCLVFDKGERRPTPEREKSGPPFAEVGGCPEEVRRVRTSESNSRNRPWVISFLWVHYRGKRLCLVLNLETILGDGTDKASVMTSIKPLLGNIKTVIFSM